jgi:hypothetical protein
MKQFNLCDVVKRCLVMAMLLALCACGPTAPSARAAASAPAKKEYKEQVALAIEGYNYTNRHIDSFTVDGNGGGNLYVSSPASGGGGTLCCVRYRPGTTDNTVTVRWQSGDCYYHVASTISKEIFDRYFEFYKEAQVKVTDDVPPDAKYMEIHFYPDGSVQAAVTATASPPRLLLNKQREDKTRSPWCPHDKKPA